MANTKASSASLASRLGPTLVVRGTIRSAGDLEIAGRVEGSIDVEGALDIEESARIRCAVSGGRVTVRGAILGDVTGSEAVVLEAGARVVGDLAAPSIGIRPGGLLRGHVASGELAGAAAAKSPAARRTESAPRAVRQPPVAPPTRRDPAPAEAARHAEAKPEAPKQEPPHTKPAAVHRNRPAPTTRSNQAPANARSAPEAAPAIGEDPLAELLRQAPPPIMPSLPRGAKAALKKKSR
ncbi:MAG: polymer-forming cytoskeletal protein [Polyangiaceae bacterium]